MGTLLRAVNGVADAVLAEFPDVMVDTLAYHYTRTAPNVTVPRRNVVVRLCSIECNFAQPFSHPSNQAFMKDLSAWSALAAGRLCVRPSL